MAAASGRQSLGSLEVLAGFLTVKRSTILKAKSTEKQWCILYHGVKTLSPRIDLHDNNPKTTGAPCKKTIYIESASWKKVSSLEPAFSFEVKNGKQWLFYCGDQSEYRKWILTLCCISGDLFDSKHMVGISNDGSISAAAVPGDEYAVVVQNDVYGGAPEEQVFIVLADQTDGCAQFGWTGVFKLCIGHGRVSLLDFTSNAQVVEWGMTELRNFGSSTHTIFLQSGKRAPTNEGKFTFRTTESSKIIGVLSRETQMIRQGTGNSHSPASTATNAPHSVQTNNTDEDTYAIVADSQSDSVSSSKIISAATPPRGLIKKDTAMNAPHKVQANKVDDEDSYAVVADCQAGFGIGSTSKIISAATPPPGLIKKDVKGPVPLPPLHMPSNGRSDAVYNNNAIVKEAIAHTRSLPTTSQIDSCNNNAPSSPSGGINDDEFRKELGTALGNNLPLARKPSTATSHSSDSGNKKDQKKKLKDLQREQKRKDEEEKKAMKKRAEEEKKEMKRQQKLMKKQKDQRQKSNTDDSQSNGYSDAVYAEAGDFGGHGSPQASVAVPKDQPQDQHYADPWDNNTLVKSLMSAQRNDTPVEDIYASPNKPMGNPKPEQGDADSDMDSFSGSDTAPPIIPPMWDGNDAEPGDLYASTNQVPDTTYGHVYGLGSASKPFTPNDSSVNVYDM